MKHKRVVLFVILCVVSVITFVIFNFFLQNKKYTNVVTIYANKYELDVSLVYAIIKTESNFDKKAVSKSGALGLMQIIPSTAKWIASELDESYDKNKMFEPETNIKYGCYYLKYLFDKFENIDIVICAYNAGENAVLKWIDDNGVLNKNKIDYAETKNYLDKVKVYYKVYKSSDISI